MDPLLDCMSVLCRRKHKKSRYRDGHKFGRKYAMSTLSGDNNGNGPSKNLSSVRFGADIGGGDRGNDSDDDPNNNNNNNNEIAATDHTNYKHQLSIIRNRHGLGPRVHTTVKRAKTSRTEQNMRNMAAAETTTTTHHVDFANIAASGKRIHARDPDDDGSTTPMRLVPAMRNAAGQTANGKKPMSSVGDPTDLYSKFNNDVYSPSGSDSVQFPSALRNTPAQGRDVYLTPGFNTAGSSTRLEYAINLMTGRGSSISDSTVASQSRTAGILYTPTEFRNPALITLSSADESPSSSTRRIIREMRDASVASQIEYERKRVDLDERYRLLLARSPLRQT